MSRYTCDFLVNLSPAHVRSPLKKLLADCGLEIVYDLEDYLMAREIPGRVSFARLVTAEVLIDVTKATRSAVNVSFIIKNEELPLNFNNHCRQVFDLLRLTIAHHDGWQPIDLQSNVPFAPSITTPHMTTAAISAAMN